jgi:bacillithiol system protein YtxJ
MRVRNDLNDDENIYDRGVSSLNNSAREIQQVSEWKAVLEASYNKPQFIFKHSTRCPISFAAYDEYSSYLEAPSEQTDHHLVKVVESRSVSNEIQSDLNVRHQSPQAILVKNGKAIWNSSHSDITITALEEHLKG